jgi:hypothetical protein
MLDRTTTLFSHVKPTDTDYQSGGLRDFFLYRDLGVAEATHGKGDRAPGQGQHGTGKGHRLAPA